MNDPRPKQPISETAPPVQDDAQRQELVAYLDGEITGAQRTRIEQRLGTDETYRQQLVELEQSWNLLDTLPLAEADAKFTESTVTMATVAAQQQMQSGWQRHRKWVAALAVAAGFLLVGIPLVQQRRANLRDVPVIHNMDLYLHAESVEFLRMLRDEGVFAEVDDDEVL